MADVRVILYRMPPSGDSVGVGAGVKGPEGPSHGLGAIMPATDVAVPRPVNAPGAARRPYWRIG